MGQEESWESESTQTGQSQSKDSTPKNDTLSLSLNTTFPNSSNCIS
jgi:hypothetical protein